MTAPHRNGIAFRRDVLAQWHTLKRATEGSVATEYGLIAALVVMVIVVALSQVRTGLLNLPFPALIAAFVDALS